MDSALDLGGFLDYEAICIAMGKPLAFWTQGSSLVPTGLQPPLPRPPCPAAAPAAPGEGTTPTARGSTLPLHFPPLLSILLPSIGSDLCISRGASCHPLQPAPLLASRLLLSGAAWEHRPPLHPPQPFPRAGLPFPTFIARAGPGTARAPSCPDGSAGASNRI